MPKCQVAKSSLDYNSPGDVSSLQTPIVLKYSQTTPTAQIMLYKMDAHLVLGFLQAMKKR